MYRFIKTVKIILINKITSDRKLGGINIKNNIKTIHESIRFCIAWKEKRRALKSSIRLMLKTLIAIYS